MGRGRAKAKQTKVARNLKYQSTNTDFSKLQAELSTSAILPNRDEDKYLNPNFQSERSSQDLESEPDSI